MNESELRAILADIEKRPVGSIPPDYIRTFYPTLLDIARKAPHRSICQTLAVMAARALINNIGFGRDVSYTVEDWSKIPPKYLSLMTGAFWEIREGVRHGSTPEDAIPGVRFDVSFFPLTGRP